MKSEIRLGEAITVFMRVQQISIRETGTLLVCLWSCLKLFWKV